MSDQPRSDDELEQDVTRAYDERNGDEIEVEIPATTAPTFPVEHTLNNSHTFFQRTIGGGMDVKFVALVTLPDGRNLPSPEATVIRFNPEAWERHKRAVAADGEQSKIETVRHFPGGLLNGDAL